MAAPLRRFYVIFLCLLSPSIYLFKVINNLLRQVPPSGSVPTARMRQTTRGSWWSTWPSATRPKSMWMTPRSWRRQIMNSMSCSTMNSRESERILGPGALGFVWAPEMHDIVFALWYLRQEINWKFLFLNSQETFLGKRRGLQPSPLKNPKRNFYVFPRYVHKTSPHLVIVVCEDIANFLAQ